MKIGFVAAAAFAALVSVGSPASAQGVSAADGGVVRLRCGTADGSGVMLSGDTFLTANHVINDDTCSVRGGDGRFAGFEVLVQDPSLDLVIARTSALGHAVAPVNCAGMIAGQEYSLIGFVKGTARTLTVTATGSFANAAMRTGVVQRVRAVEGDGRSDRGREGMSGGAVLDNAGRVVAFISAVGKHSNANRTYVKEVKDTPVCQA